MEVSYTGDADFDASASVQYRVVGEERWRTGHPLARISERPTDRDGRGAVNPGFAASIFYLEENTGYEVKVTFKDPDGVEKQLEPGRVKTRNSHVPLGGGKHFYVNPAAAADGDGSNEKPFKTLQSALKRGGPGDTIHFAKGTHYLKGVIQTRNSGNEKAWLHLKAEPGAIITDASPELSGVGKLKWERFKRDVNGRWIYRADVQDVSRVMLRKKPGDPASGYFLWRFHPKSRGPHRGQNLQHMVDDFTGLNRFGTFFQDKDALYAVFPEGFDDPTELDLQISQETRNMIWFLGHHVVVEGFTIELTVGIMARSDKYGAHHHIFRRLSCYGSMRYGLWSGTYSLVEDSKFIFNAHWDWFTAPPAKDGSRAWQKIKNGYNDTHMLKADSHSVIRYNLIHGHSNAIPYASGGGGRAKGSRNIDIHNNLIALTGDDCVEPDGPFINGRMYNNKMFNFFNGFSDAPISIGPAFVVRNVFYGYHQAAFKIRNGADGVALYYHNTCYPNLKDVRAYSDTPDGQYCYAPDGDGVRWMKTRNNIFISKKEAYVVSRRLGPRKIETLDMDYNCLWTLGGKRSRRIIGEAHSLWTMPEFVNLAEGDMRLKRREQPCIDAGEIIKGINDEVPEPYQYKGRAPDQGAFEWGAPIPHYGPRLERPKVSAAEKAGERESIRKGLAREKVARAVSVGAHAELMERARKAAADGRFDEAARLVEEEASRAASGEARGALLRAARGFRATRELRKLIIENGRGKRVFIAFLGRTMRGKILRADERGLAAEVFGNEVEVGWEALSSRRFLALARRAAGEEASDAVRALFDDFAFAQGIE